MSKINSLRNHTAIKLLVSVLSLLLVAVAFPLMLRAEESNQDNSGSAPQQQEVKIPQTAKDHWELVEHYQKQAAEDRQEIKKHQEMLSEYSKGVVKSPKEILENAYIRKMRLHCGKYIQAAEDRAREADGMAQFHTFRAKELEGK